MVGPFATANEASELYKGLKAAGGQCLIQRNSCAFTCTYDGRGLIRANGGTRIHHRIERAHDFRQ